MPMEKLKCPACKNPGQAIKNKDDGSFQIECSDCRMRGPVGETEPQAWRRWNDLTRVPLKYLNISEASEYLRMGESSLRKIQHEIPHSRIGENKGRIIFPITDLDKYVKENRV